MTGYRDIHIAEENVCDMHSLRYDRLCGCLLDTEQSVLMFHET